MGAKYSHGVWEQFADQASTILGKTSLNLFMAVQTLPGLSWILWLPLGCYNSHFAGLSENLLCGLTNVV